jgi:hypothetical protein
VQAVEQLEAAAQQAVEQEEVRVLYEMLRNAMCCHVLLVLWGSVALARLCARGRVGGK